MNGLAKYPEAHSCRSRDRAHRFLKETNRTGHLSSPSPTFILRYNFGDLIWRNGRVVPPCQGNLPCPSCREFLEEIEESPQITVTVLEKTLEFATSIVGREYTSPLQVLPQGQELTLGRASTGAGILTSGARTIFLNASNARSRY